jgi:mono/diheme cytochrome c family protein
MKLTKIVIPLFLFFSLFTACQMGDSSQMSKSQQRQMQSNFESIQKSHQALLKEYQQDSASMPAEMKALYSQMQKMHQQMSDNHNHMMSGHNGSGMGMHQDDGQMKKRRQMRRQIQNRMTREWYSQMESMHQQMASRHEQMNQTKKAKQHRQMGNGFGKMKNMVPQDDQTSNEPVNNEADPALLDGANLYSQNCATCHGRNGQGFGNGFPPLVDSEWITGDKSIPLRIIRDGLRGRIEVNGETYSGTMPSFKARLSLAEIAAITNYLRKKSEGDYPEVTQEDVLEISNTYSDRNAPWQPKELLGE